MPHKHKRDKSNNDSFYDLPPTAIARPLPTLKPSTNTKNPKPPTPHRSRNLPPKKALDDDTPRAFKRLMTGYKPPSGLDDGLPTKKKQKRNPHPNTTTLPPTTTTLKIHPSEPLSTFSTRVNAALPLSSLPRSKPPRDPPSLKNYQTKTEKRMQKMQQEWRAAAAKRRKAQEESPDEALSDDNAARRKRPHPDDDPWSAIASTPLPPSTGLVGLHDVVLAPPRLVVPRGGNGGGKGVVGGLKRRGELGEARREVVEGYRRMMRGVREEGKGVGGGRG